MKMTQKIRRDLSVTPLALWGKCRLPAAVLFCVHLAGLLFVFALLGLLLRLLFRLISHLT